MNRNCYLSQKSLLQSFQCLFALAFLLLGSLPSSAQEKNQEKSKPNIVYIMSDELAYFEVGYNGADKLLTPRIDQMAREGLVFTNALAAAPVCAPLRACLMTGKHMGHCSVRANDGGTPLRADEPTIASHLKKLGYATGGFGKWGAGGRDSTGVPEKHGFDQFFGYYDQVHAHSFYPPYLIRNSEEVELPGNIGGRSGKTYSHYEIMKAGLKFIRDNKDRPFFCYLPITPPHGMYDIPDSDPAWKIFKDKDWPEDAKRYAAMVKMVDRNVGQVLDLLDELKIDENTIVFFAGDNGGQDRFRTKDHPRGFFGPNLNPETGVEFRGGKGNLYEGGLKIPSLVRWPGKVKPGSVSDLIWSQVDVFPTIADMVKTSGPSDLDGISILPTIIGEELAGRKQEKHEKLYWEYGDQVAVRAGKWKAIRTGKPSESKWALYDLTVDPSETTDLSAKHENLLKEIKEFAAMAHTPVRPGNFMTRERHERDRWAKWGDAKPPAPKLGKVTPWKKRGLLDSSKFKLVKISSENKGNGKFAKMAFDQDPRTWWHSDWNADPKKSPHQIQIDLGDEKEVTGIRYLARQDNGYNGAIAKLSVKVSAEKEGESGATFEHRFEKIKQIQDFKFKPTRGRYVTLTVISEVNGKPWASAAEIGIIGK